AVVLLAGPVACRTTHPVVSPKCAELPVPARRDATAPRSAPAFALGARLPERYRSDLPVNARTRPTCYRVRAAMNEARTRTSFFSIPELGIRHVRTPGPREKYCL